MGTHFKGNKKEILALNTWIKLARARNSVFNKIKPSMTSTGLTASQFAVLEALLFLGPMSQKQIGDKLLRTTGNIVMIVDNLEKEKLIVRKKDKDDRRINMIHLTTKGNISIKSVFNKHVENIVHAFSGLNADEQKELGRLCKKLGIS